MIVVWGVGDDEIGPDLSQQTANGGDQSHLGEQGSVGEIEELRLYAKRRGRRRGLDPSDAAEVVGRPVPARGAVSGDGERETGTHRMPGEDRAADEDFQIVGVRAKREHAD